MRGVDVFETGDVTRRRAFFVVVAVRFSERDDLYVVFVRELLQFGRVAVHAVCIPQQAVDAALFCGEQFLFAAERLHF